MSINNNYIEKASIDELIEKLAKHQIFLDKVVLLKQYANCFHLYQLLESLSLRFEKEIKALDKQNKSVNSKYIEIILDKIVRQNYDISESTDPYYLLIDINDFDQDNDISKKQLFSLVKRLLRLNDLYHLNRVDGYFKMYDEDCQRHIYDWFDQYQFNKLTKKETKEFVEVIDQFLQSYSREEELALNLELLRIERIAAISKEETIDEAIKLLKEKYPVSIFSIYSRVILGTLDNDSSKLFKIYYQKVKQYMVLTDEDREELAFIDSLYEDVMMEEAK